jgi:hypothetical protein
MSGSAVETKYCIDCRHYWAKYPVPGTCSRRTTVDVVQGVLNEFRSARHERGSFPWVGARCGPDARFFEQRPPPQPPNCGSGGLRVKP